MNRIFKISIIAGVSLSLAMSFYTYFGQKNIAFFDYNEVYNNCELKQKLEKDLLKVGSERKGELDSLQFELSFLSQKIEQKKSSQIEIDRFEEMKNRYLTYQQKYEEENMRLKETYFNQIRKEINDKAKLFAESNGIDYFFAAVGDGSLMYGSPSVDLTEEFKLYVDK